MIPANVKHFTTEGEKRFYSFLESVAKPDSKYIAWYTPDLKGKKPVKLTAADTVFGFIKRYRKGVDVSTLMKKTGFNKRKIYDNVKILKKQGKIKTAGKGVYVKA